MSIEITIARHGETEANVSGVWQGQGDAPLTALGRSQAAALGERLNPADFDLVLASDLGRARKTSVIAGLDPEFDSVWREMDIGGWEGLTRSQIARSHPDEIARLGAGEDVRMGTGETFREFGARVDAALDALIGRLDDGDRVLIVAHGGVVHAAVSGIAGFRARGRPFPIGRSINGSLTRLEVDRGEWVVAAFNDAAHLGPPEVAGGESIVALIRHGESEGNVAGRWQGVTDVPLTARGESQARALSDAYDGLAGVRHSPLHRARATAEVIADAHGLSPVAIAGLAEMAFGRWEDRTPDEIALLDPIGWRALLAGRDEPRGGSGETFSGVAERMREAVGAIAGAHVGQRVAAVSHGGAIRAFAASVMGLDFADRSRMALPANASVSHVAVSASGPTILDYNVGWI